MESLLPKISKDHTFLIFASCVNMEIADTAKLTPPFIVDAFVGTLPISVQPRYVSTAVNPLSKSYLRPVSNFPATSAPMRIATLSSLLHN